MKKKFGEVLLERGVITPAQLADALALQRRRGMRLGAALLERGHINETQLVEMLGVLLNLRVVELEKADIHDDAVSLVSARFSSEHDLFAYHLKREKNRKVLTVAMADPLNYRVVDELSFVTDSVIEPVLAKPSAIDRAIRSHYGARLTSTDLPGGPVWIEEPEASATMTILRPGGGEEIIDTTTGRIISPFIKGPDGQTIENPEATKAQPSPRAPKARAESAPILLTEEVDGVGVVDGEETDDLKLSITEGTPIPLTSIKGGQPSAPGEVEVPTAIPEPSSGLPGDAKPSYFDFALGALIDAAGGAVNAEAFYRLERRFWALMRVLSKKGILTKDDFLRELTEDDR